MLFLPPTLAIFPRSVINRRHIAGKKPFFLKQKGVPAICADTPFSFYHAIRTEFRKLSIRAFCS